MWPYITLFGLKIYMTGLGVVIAFATFCFGVHLLANRRGLKFAPFFYRLPLLIIITYVCGAYAHFLIDGPGTIIPLSTAEVLRLVSPEGYRFHFIGIVVGIALSFVVFLREVKSTVEKIRRIDVFFISTCAALVPLGVFFMLGDNVMGMQTTSSRGITGLGHPDSKLEKIGVAVLPIGGFISLFALVCLIIYVILKLRNKRIIGYGLLGFAILLAGIALILVFQSYPRHLPLGRDVVGLGFDIKQYFTLIVCIVLYRKRRKLQRLIEHIKQQNK